MHVSAWVSDVQWEFCSKSQLQSLLSSCQFSLKRTLESPFAELPAALIAEQLPTHNPIPLVWIFLKCETSQRIELMR